jgi:DNA-binding XRE family transcriptional regulator
MTYTPLKQRITQLGLKNKYIAEQVGIHPAVMSMYVTGRRIPPLEDALKIAHILQTTVEDIWGYTVINWLTTQKADK